MKYGKMILGISAAASATVAMLVAAPTYSQTKPMPLPEYVGGEATIYRDAGYQGPAVAVANDKTNLGLAWRVNSVRVRGGRWQLCERTNFRGECRTIESDTPMMYLPMRGMTVQSIRLVSGGGGGGGVGIGDGGPSMRGMASQYYTQPMLYGTRVQGCQYGSPSASCASRTADQFCQNMGWTASNHERLETVNSRTYLADVLCTRTG